METWVIRDRRYSGCGVRIWYGHRESLIRIDQKIRLGVLRTPYTNNVLKLTIL